MSSISRIVLTAVLVTATGAVNAHDAAATAQVEPAAAAAPADAAAPAPAAAADAPEAVEAAEPAETAEAPEAPEAAEAAAPAPAAAPAADTPVNASYHDEPSWMPAAQPGKGLVIIYREKRFVGGGAKMKFFYDDTAFTPLKNGKFVYAYLEPGDHKIYSDKKKQSDAHLLAIEPGDVHFFEATIAMGMWKANTDLLETDASVAKQKIGANQK